MALQIADLTNARMSGANALVWVDLETTGTVEDRDEIIEIGAILTDFEFNRIGDPFQQTVTPSDVALGRLMKTKVVREMHQANGLLDEVLDNGPNVAPTIEIAETILLKWLNETFNSKSTKGPIAKFRFMLAGSGVGHFDRRFIKRYMPRLDNLLVFAPLDIGNIRRLFKFSGVELSPPSPPDAKNHRALDDIRLHLEEARYYRTLLHDTFVGPN